MDSAHVVLRYFPVRGRAQAFRHALADAGVAFEDVHVEMSDWPQHIADPSFSGFFGSLPTLTWGDVTVGETLAIAPFLSRRLGEYARVDDAEIARRESVSSTCSTDILTRIAEIIWLDFLYPGADAAQALPRSIARMIDKLARIGAVLGDASYLGGESPCVADFFAGEAVDTLRYVLGGAHDAALVPKIAPLVDLAGRIRARPAIVKLPRAEEFTTHPDEAIILRRLRAVDLSSAGL